MHSASEAEIRALVADLTDEEIETALYDWPLWARPDQLAPPGQWVVWLLMGGRGAGKTRSGAEWVRAQVKAGRGLIHLVAETAADCRDVMVEGPSGILKVSWTRDRDAKGRYLGVPVYEPSKRRLTWANGATAICFSADDPEQLRGPQCDGAWADEVGKWRYAEDTWSNLMFGLRLGHNPQCVATSTPRPIKMLRELVRDPTTVVSRESTYANRANLAASFFAKVIKKYEGTRLGRQELLAELLEDLPGALWQRALLDQHRVRRQPDELVRVVVAIDPAGSTEEDSDETGIVVAGRTRTGHAFVLEDLSCKETPEGWASAAIKAYDRWQADRIVGEVNNGGDMVGAVIRASAKAMKLAGTRPTDEVSYRAVRASRGKALRAEPVAALYEQGRVHHVGAFAELEDQLCAITPDFDRAIAGFSPDRADAAVWALTELMLTGAEPADVPPLPNLTIDPDNGSYWRPA